MSLVVSLNSVFDIRVRTFASNGDPDDLIGSDFSHIRNYLDLGLGLGTVQILQALETFGFSMRDLKNIKLTGQGLAQLLINQFDKAYYIAKLEQKAMEIKTKQTKAS